MKHLLFLLPLITLCSCSGTSAVSSSVSSSTSTSKNSSASEREVPPRAPILVAYFSVTGNTKPLAEFAADRYNCDLFEIVPTQEYTQEDIDYTNSNCRALKEQNDSSARPEIKYQVEEMYKYSAIILGYPIWAGEAPKIMYTFLESYNFNGKQILPFCTSGSSQIGSSATNLAKSAPKATWLDGKRFAAGTDKKTFAEWLPTFTF